MLRVELADWNTMRQWAAPLRHAVCVDEQKVPEDMEIDHWDPQCVHAVAFDAQSMAVGTGRLLPHGHGHRRGRPFADDGCGADGDGCRHVLAPVNVLTTEGGKQVAVPDAPRIGGPARDGPVGACDHAVAPGDQRLGYERRCHGRHRLPTKRMSSGSTPR